MKQMHYLLVGLPFSGKTILAKELQERFGFARVNIDEIKFEKGYRDVSDDDVPDKVWEEIHKEIDKRLVDSLKEGKTVLNENAWMKKEWRDGKKKIAQGLGVSTKVIYLQVPEEVIRKRWRKNKETKERFDVPDNILEEAFREFEVPTEDEDVIVYTSETNFETWVTEHFK